MDHLTIFTKTARGLGETLGKTRALSREARKILKEIDGQATLGDLIERLGIADAKLQIALAKLLADDYIREFGMAAAPAAVAAESMGDTGFGMTSPAPLENAFSQLTIGDFIRAMEAPAAESGALNFRSLTQQDQEEAAAEAAEKARVEDTLRRAQQAREQAQADEQARLAAEHAARVKAEEAARLAAEQQARMVAQEAARREAEARARREAEQMARRKEEEAAQRAAQERARQEAEEQARLAAQAQRAAEEAARQQAEQQARREHEEALRRQAEAARLLAAEQARQEAERRAQQEAQEAQEAARRLAEEQARLAAQDALRREAEQRAQQEAEARAKRQAEERAQQEAREQARLLAEEQARRQAEQQAEEAARRAADERARQEAEVEAKKQAEEAARQKAWEAARRAAEELAQREADEAARRAAQAQAARAAEEEAQRLAQEQARLAAEAAAQRQAEEERRRAAEEERRRQAEAQARLAAEAKAKRAAEKLAQQQAREQAKREAAEQARLKKAEQARAKAAQQAQRDAERAAQQAARDAARQQADEQARAAAAEKARQTAEAKAQKAAADAARQAARAAEKAKAEQEGRRLQEEKAARRAETRAAKAAAKEAARQEKLAARRQPGEKRMTSDGPLAPGKLLALAAGGMMLALAVAVVALQLVSFDSRIPLLAETVAARIGHPVAIKKLHLRLWPRPHWRIEGVAIGDAGQIAVDRIDADAALAGLLGERIAVTALDLQSPVITAEGLDWLLFGKAGKAGGDLQQLRARYVSLLLPHVKLPKFDVDVALGDGGAWRKITMDAVAGKTHVQLQPSGAKIQVQLSADAFALPFGSGVTLDQFNASGLLGRDALAIREFNGILFDGRVGGQAELAWDDGWRLEGELQARGLDAARFMPALLQESGLDIKGRFAMRAAQADQLFAHAGGKGSFAVSNGALPGIDLAGLVLGQDGRGKSGFNSLSGDWQLDDGKLQLRRVQLAAGLLSAAGSVEVDAAGAIDGRFALDFRTATRHARADVALAGSVSQPQFKR